MLAELSIKNYALIDDLHINFKEGFTTITGETGAGKSILLGALSLVLGKRADLSSLKNKEKKCSIEAEFEVQNYGLKPFFKQEDLDYESRSILRREILPSGKSRAFINDSPVTLNVLSALGERLVDIHSQHQTMQLTENSFHFRLVDALAGNATFLKEYQELYKTYHKQTKALEQLQTQKLAAEKELDYNTFLLEELEKAPLQAGILEELETTYETLNNVEQLLEVLGQAHSLLNDEQYGVLTGLGQLQQLSQKLTGFGANYTAINNRIQSIAIELADLAAEAEDLTEAVEPNPERLETVNGQLQQIHNLFNKHQVNSVVELISIKTALAEKVALSLNMDDTILNLEKELAATKEALKKIGDKLSAARKKAIPKLKQRLEEGIGQLGMEAASFKIAVSPSPTFKTNGLDELVFLFSANKGSNYGELKKVASGGELSRIMLAIKAILAAYEKLPSLIFDEIDTGVSGEISNKMGEIMQAMGKDMQVFSITHLPQVAAKGAHQFKVFKEQTQNNTATHIIELDKNERIRELAEMLGGKEFSETALTHARELILQK